MISISISTNFLVVLSIFILIFIIGIIAYIIYKDKKIDQEEIDDLIDDIVKAKPRKEIVNVTKIEPKEEKSQINLEAMLEQMQNDLEKKQADVIEQFEDDQEKNAIISYKELIKANNENLTDAYEKEQEEKAITNYKQINSLDVLEENENFLFDKIEQVSKKKVSKIASPREEKDKKFKNTDFISPIYGKMDNKVEYPKVKSYDKYDDLNLDSYFGEDIKYNEYQDVKIENSSTKNDEFLRELKNFRNNL